MKSTVLSVLLGLLVLLGTCSAHGYILQSRSHLCTWGNDQQNKNCDAARDEPQSLQGPSSFPAGGPKDGFIASAQHPRFHGLNGFGAGRWTVMPISTYVVGEKEDGKLVLNFPWYLTAPHVTTRFEYFISKPTFDPTKSLTRAQLELTPFCVDESAKDIMPSKGDYIGHNCELDAAKYNGHHVILGVWTIFSPPSAFYQVVDVNFTAKPETCSCPPVPGA